jgi:type IV pilus assembly protein PilW
MSGGVGVRLGVGVGVRVRSRGFSLVELMVSLTIGSALIVGAVYVYSDSQTAYRLNENVARVQEQGRYVLSVIEPDLELAGYYGYTNSPDAIRYVQGASPQTVIAYANDMRQYAVGTGAASPPAVSNQPAGANACGVNYAIDVLMPVEGTNGSATPGSFGPGRDATDCDPSFPQQGGTDTLTIRRADTAPVAAQAGRLQIYTSQLTSRTSQLLFSDGVAPGPLDATDPQQLNQVHNLIVRMYYIAQRSDDQPGVPTLRKKSLQLGAGSKLVFQDDEIMPGVEDLQVQFGIDTGDYDNDGQIDAGLDPNGNGVPQTDGRATRYVNPDPQTLARYQVVAVRIWVRVRADQPEVGFVDTKTYQYADIPPYTPQGADQHYRRAVVSRTIMLRNSRTL